MPDLAVFIIRNFEDISKYTYEIYNYVSIGV